MIKNYKEFIKENVDSDQLQSELEINGITDKEIFLINKLKEIAKKSNVEESHNIFFKEPVVIGQRSGKDVICNYYYIHENPYWNEDYLVFHIMYNEKPYKNKQIYDRVWDFSLMNYMDIKRGVHSQRPYKKGEFGKPVNMRFQFDKDFLEKIYNSASKLSDEWIKEVDEVRKESRDWGRMCSNPKGCPNIDWERQLYHAKCSIFYNRILNVHEPVSEINTLKEMEEMGEEAYTAKMKRQSDLIADIIKDSDWFPKKKN